MNTISTDTLPNLEQYLNVLEFWHKVEFFIPFDLQKQVIESTGSDWSVRLFTKGELLKVPPDNLWTACVPNGGKLSGFELYIGVFDKVDLSSITKCIVTETLTQSEEFEQTERSDLEGPTCFARIKLNANGEPLFSDVSISTVPWALGSLKQNGLDGLSFDAFQDGLLELQAHLITFQTNQIRKSRSQSSTDASTEDSGSYPLSASDILELLEVFYNWAKFWPDTQSSVVAIRAKAENIPKKSADESGEEIESESAIDSEISILNSFYIKDIERAIASLKKGEVNSALVGYLTAIPDKERIDLYTAEGRKHIINCLHPKFLNMGHWLDDKENMMSLMQQFAIGQVFDRLNNGGVFSVNGPPGTGKTTLLRDIFAENITRRARVLSGYQKANDAFQAKGLKVQFIGNDKVYEISPIQSELTGFEMVVASSNNAAVENISLDLPKTDKLGKNWRNEDGTNKFGYLQPIAHKNATQNAYGQYEAIEAKDAPWGLVSCALGNYSNRKKFVERLTSPGGDPEKPYPYGIKKPYPKGFNPDIHQSIWLWKKRYKGVTFSEAKKNFNKADQSVNQRLHELQKFVSLSDEIRLQTEIEFIGAAKTVLEKAQHSLHLKKDEIHSVDTDFELVIGQLSSLEREEQLIKEQTPSWFMGLFKRTLRNECIQELSGNQAEQRELQKRKRNLTSKLATFKIQLSDIETEVANADKYYENRRILWNSKLKSFAALKGEFPHAACPENADDVELAYWQKSGIWCDQELNKLRSELFAASLQLHEAWLAEAKITQNIFAIGPLLLGKRLQDPMHALEIWRSLFMIVPVISSAFASFGSQFRDLGCDSIGWLFIDEAGQAVPQAAVGALWRCKRAVIVGDPLQIEPVFTVPIKLIEAIFKSSKIPEHLNVMPHKASVQNLADEANSLGTLIGNDEDKPKWVGSPLRVHRRCLDPMFTISNVIAYNSKMVYGLEISEPPAESLNLGRSAWINVPGIASDKQIIPEQIEFVFHAFVRLYQLQQQLPNLYIISPFKHIKAELIKALEHTDSWTKVIGFSGYVPKKAELKEWCKQRIGTVHTFQGKEESMVWMVLGCDDKNMGAVTWASNKPNLLNVALTRAKHRFFMVGDIGLWGEKNHFCNATEPWLSILSPEQFLLMIENLESL